MPSTQPPSNSDPSWREIWERLSGDRRYEQPIDMPSHGSYQVHHLEQPIVQQPVESVPDLGDLTRIIRSAYAGVVSQAETQRMLGERGVVAISTERDEPIMGIRIMLTLMDGRRVGIRMSDEERHLLSGPSPEMERLGRMTTDRAPHLHPEMRRRPGRLTDPSVAYRDTPDERMFDPRTYRRMALERYPFNPEAPMSREALPSEAFDAMIARAEAVRREAASEMDAYDGYDAMVAQYGPVFVAGRYDGSLFYEREVTPNERDWEADWRFANRHDVAWHRRHYNPNWTRLRCNACVSEEEAYTARTEWEMRDHLIDEHGFDSALRIESLNPYTWAHAEAIA